MRRAAILAMVTGVCIAIVPVAGARVLRVGTYKGIHGQFKSIQAAVNAAKPGDWILVGPGDYKTTIDPCSQGGTRHARRGADHHRQPEAAGDEPQQGRD